jgi:flagellar protein FlbD
LWGKRRMISVTRFDGTELVVNVDHIVTIERTPDTVLALITGDRIMVRETVEQVIERAIHFRHRIVEGPGERDGNSELATAGRDREGGD